MHPLRHPNYGPFYTTHFCQLEVVEISAPKPLNAVWVTPEGGTNGPSNSSLFLPLQILLPGFRTKTAGQQPSLHQLTSLSPQISGKIKVISGQLNNLWDQFDSLATAVFQNLKRLDLTAKDGIGAFPYE